MGQLRMESRRNFHNNKWQLLKIEDEFPRPIFSTFRVSYAAKSLGGLQYSSRNTDYLKLLISGKMKRLEFV
jgi:hypothetical protein